jgi:hypothetical protein
LFCHNKKRREERSKGVREEKRVTLFEERFIFFCRYEYGCLELPILSQVREEDEDQIMNKQTNSVCLSGTERQLRERRERERIDYL